MASVALVSILSLDRVGLVSAIADCLFAAGINLRDTSFAVLGKGAEFTSVCELPEGVTIDTLRRDLGRVPELAGAQIQVAPYGFDPLPGPMGKITHRIEVSGGDQLGLIARLSEIFTQNGANIVRLDAQKLPEAEGGRYVTRFSVWLPPERAALCLAAVDSTAGSLGLASRAETVEPGASNKKAMAG
ncbi:MAG TPA: amino acid-binding protein [Stellaceae bacterium]|nr:amino acid-binding protein [Stellaceae bacterium]